MWLRNDLARFAARAGSLAVRNASVRCGEVPATRGVCTAWRSFEMQLIQSRFRGSPAVATPPGLRRQFSTTDNNDIDHFASAEKAIITAYGPDRPGLVSSLAKSVLTCGGNVENTRMARLGDDCNVMMLVSFADSTPEERVKFARDAQEIPGLTVKVRPTKSNGRGLSSGPIDTSRWRRVFLHGTDFKGSLHAVTSYLGEENINIETLNTDTTHAPFGEDHLFTMEAVIEIGPNVSLSKFKQTMDKLKRRLGVDIVISEHESHRDD